MHTHDEIMYRRNIGRGEGGEGMFVDRRQGTLQNFTIPAPHHTAPIDVAWLAACRVQPVKLPKKQKLN